MDLPHHSSKKSRPKIRNATKYAMFGALFGLAFPIISTPIASAIEYSQISLEYLIKIQQTNPLMWVINTAPVFLGLFAYYGGVKQDQLVELIEKQDEIINDQTRALREALKEAQGAIKVKGQFVANMSHELRTPLNAIIGYSEMIEDELASLKGIDPHRSQLLIDDTDRILQAGRHLLSVVNSILEFSKIDAMQEELRLEPFNLYEVTNESFELAAPKIVQKNIDYQFNSQPELNRVVLGDMTKYRQVLLNLLSNAQKFTSEGFIRLEVDVQELPAKNLLRVTGRVLDSGIGIEPSQLKSIFLPFNQSDNSIAREYGGTGLGLTISKFLCQSMHGDLTMHSQGLGCGSTATFQITLEKHDDAYQEHASDIQMDAIDYQ